MTFVDRFSRLPALAQFLVLGGLLLVVFLADFITGYEIASSLFYLAPIGIGVWGRSRNTGVVLCGLSAVSWGAADVISGHVYSHPYILVWNIFVRLALFLIVTATLAALRETLHDRDALIEELRTALDNAKTFDGLRPICYSCRRVREENGSWESIEEFVRKKSDIEFTSSVCPECSGTFESDAHAAHQAKSSSESGKIVEV